MTLQRRADRAIQVGEGGGEQVGGFLAYREFLQSINLGSVAANTAENEDMTVTGVAVGDIVLYATPAEGLVADIIVAALGPIVTADVVRFRVCNTTAAAIDAAAVDFRVGVLRPSTAAV